MTIKYNMKLFTGLTAVVAYGLSAHLLFAGFPATPLYIAMVASAGALGLIVVEWSRV